MSKEYDPNDAVEFIFKKAGSYAAAKGKLAEVEAFKSSLKAIQMAKSGEQSLGAQEREAYRSLEYQELCKAIGIATEEVEKLKWELEAAKMRWETWRTQQATNRQVERMLG
jgi:hypothetical protein